MATIGTLVVYLDINSSALKKGEVQAKKSFVGMEKQAKKSFGNIESFAIDAAKSIGTIYAGLQLVGLIKDTIKTADTMKLLNSRLQLVTDGQKEFTEAQQELFDISNKTRTAFGSTLTLYTRMARSAKDTGRSQREMLDVTDAINKAVAVSGANTIEATNAMIQFSQGLGEGSLRGEEINSVLSQTPRVAQLIADGLGVTTQALRKMGSEGKLGPEKIIKAILSQRDVIDREFATMPKTVGKAMTVATNHIQKFIGEFDKAAGMTDAIADGIDDITAAIKGVDAAEIGKIASAMIGIGTAATGTIKVIAAYYALFVGPKVIAGIGAWVSSMYTAAGATVQLNTAVAAGDAVMLNSAKATAMRAAAEAEAAAVSVRGAQSQVVRTEVDIAAIQAKVALINTEKNQIMTLIQEGSVTADVTILEQRFAVASRAAAAAQMNLRNAVAANTTSQVGLATATANSTKATLAAGAAAKKARMSLLTLNNAANVLLAGFVGWQIGKWLTKNFEWARVAGIHFVDDTIKGWYHLEKIVKTIFNSIGVNWKSVLNTIKITYSDFIDLAAKGVGILNKSLARDMKVAAAELRKSLEKELTFGEAKVKINLEFDEKMAERGKRIGQMLGEASGAAATRAAMIQKAPKKPKPLGGLDEEAKKLADAQQSLLDRLLPLQKLQKDYQGDLALLEGWYAKNATKTAEYEVALNNLNQAYEEGKQAILSPELEARIKNEEQLRDILFNRIEMEKAAIDMAVTAKELTGTEEAKARIGILNQELQARQAIHDQILGASNEAIIARQEELMSIQEINMAIMEQQALLSNTSWVEGAKAAWAEYSQAALDSGGQAEQFFSSTFQKLEDAVVSFAETGTLEFEEFAKSVLSELLRVQVRALMVKAITSIAGSFHDGMDPSYTPPQFHNGMSPSYQPPRFHDGLKPDEFPAIIQEGERITSKKDVNTQNEQLADYERFKNTGGGKAGGGMSVSVPINLDPSFSKRFRSELQDGIEGQVMKTINKFS